MLVEFLGPDKSFRYMLHPPFPMKNLRHLGHVCHLVTLGLLASAASLQAQITWVGETSASWGTTSNWDLFRVPNTTEQVIFPSFGLNKTMSNNRTAGTVYTRLTFSGSGYTLNGTNSIALLGAGTQLIETTHTSGTTTLNCPITLGEPATFSSSGFSGSPFFTSGNLVVGGTVTLGANLLTLSTTTAIDIDGTISGTGGVTTTSTGTVRFDGNQLFTGLTTVGSTSDLQVNGSMPGSVSVGSTGTLSGSGTIGGSVFVSGDVTPGPGASVGRLTITGNLEFQTGTEDDAFFNLDSTTVATGYDQFRVGGSVTPNSARINLDPLGGFPVGSSFILIDKTSAGAMTTGFRTAVGSTLSEGTRETIGMNVFRYSYIGGTGNDFTATTVLSTSSGTREWDGGGNTSWGNVTNWSGNIAPIATNTITFGSLAAAEKRVVITDVGGNPYALSFTSGGYSLNSGVAITLSNGIIASHTSGINTINSSLILGAPQSFTLTGAGDLTVAGTVDNSNDTLTVSNTSTGTLRLNGALSGGGSLIIDGGGFVELGGAVSNTYAGTTTINHGELRLTKSTGVAIPGNVTIGDGSSTASLVTTVTEKIANSAVVTVKTAATFAPAALETIGGLVLDGGAVNSGVNLLAIMGNITANQTTDLFSRIQINSSVRNWTVAEGKTLRLYGPLTISPTSSGITQRKTGSGTLVVAGNAAVTTFDLQQGTLQLDNLSETLTLGISLNGGTLSGSGRAVSITAAAAGGVISPATDTGSAIFKATRLTANSATTLEFDINGATAGSGHDQLDIAASSIDPSSNGVTLASAVLLLRDSVALPVGTIITLIKNDGNDAVSGTFTGLANLAFVTTDFNRFILSYNGGTGNDVTLTAVTPPASGTTRVWDGGGGGNTSWLTAANWAGDVVPAPGDSLEFPSAVHVTSANDFPAGMIFHSLTFSGIGSNSTRAISGNAIQLTGNITCSVSDSPARFVEVLLPITLLSDASITNTNQRSLRFKSPLVTTTANLRFSGDGSATQRNILFLTGGGLLSGPAKVRVEANVNVNLASSIAHTYAGGSFVDSGNIIGRADVVTANGLTLGTGASIATAFLTPIDSPLTGTIIVNSQATLDFSGRATNQTIQNLQLNNGSVVGENLTLSGDLTIDGSDSLIVATLACQNFNYSNGSCAISSALTCQDYTQSAPTLTVPNVTLSGNLSLAAGAALATTQLAAPDAAGTHTLAIAAGSQITTGSFGNPILANQNFLVTGSGLLQVNTLLATDILRVAGPELRHNGSVPESSPFKAQARLDGGKVSGNGLFRNIEVLAGGGQIAPGTSPGILTSQSAQLNSATTVVYEINSATAGTGHDRFSVGTIVPGNATVSLVLAPGYVPLVGQEFILLQHNLDSIPFPGTFAGISEGGARTLVPGITVAFSYQGGDGNDFSATVTNSPAGAYRVWDGGGSDDKWATAANWVEDSVPLPMESLRFPAGASRTANTNNFAAGFSVGEIKIEDGYTLSGNLIRPTRGIIADLPTGAATVSLPLLFETGDLALIALSGGGSLAISGQIDLGDIPTLTLRRTDPSFVFGGQPLDVAAIRRIGAAANEVLVEGGGRVRFRNGTRDYTGPTLVRHGRLQLDGASSGIPGNLTIGGGAGLAKFENPGSSAGGIPGFATLRLEPNGEHTFIGGGTFSDTVGIVDFAGGSSTQGGLPIRTKWITRAPFNYTSTGAALFETSVVGGTKIIEIETGARHTIPAGSSIATGDFQAFNLRKDGGGELRIAGTLTATTIQVAVGTLTADAGGNINATTVTLAGGTLAGSVTVNADLQGSASGGFIAPGLAASATPFGILTIHEKDYLPAPQTTLSIQIGGTTPGTQHDQLRQTRTFQSPVLDLNESLLSVSLVNGFQPTPGQTFRIIDKQSPGAVIRNFAGKPEGSSFQAAGFNWTITYAGGDGNDVILTAGTRLAPAAPLAFSGAPVIQPANGVHGARITTAVSGPPGALVRLESSADLGFTSPWLTIGQITLDGSGNGNFTAVADPRSAPPLPALKNFFRLVID